jgi:hypothetical protein
MVRPSQRPAKAVRRTMTFLDKADGRVERSLYQRANGYNYEAVKIFMPAGAKQPIVVHYVEHMPLPASSG